METKCMQCNNLFDGKRADAKFCSDTCRKKYKRILASSPPPAMGDTPTSPPPETKVRRVKEKKPIYRATASRSIYDKPSPEEAAKRLRILYNKQLPGEK